MTAAVGERLLPQLRAGDEEAFGQLVNAWTPGMLRTARPFVSSSTEAEEVVQETWAAIAAGLERFEERSSLRTWVYSILTNRARSRGSKEARSVPFSSLAAQEVAAGSPAVEPELFNHAGRWTSPPQRWEELPEEALRAQETRDVLRDALATLTAPQRLVVTLRDIEGFSGEEAAMALGMAAGHQRVLLHRARAKLRARLEEYLS